ncbi:hypothetical protein [Leptospira licerasiae]|uniref:hypothetical protein n=1 Tax=Leptospira licerasiae TaxID=447106 RepID=UPI003016CB02
MEEFLSRKFDLKLSEESKNLHNKMTELKVEISDFLVYFHIFPWENCILEKI